MKLNKSSIIPETKEAQEEKISSYRLFTQVNKKKNTTASKYYFYDKNSRAGSIYLFREFVI